MRFADTAFWVALQTSRGNHQLATRPTAREMFERIEARGSSRRFSIEQAVQSVRADRDGIS